MLYDRRMYPAIHDYSTALPLPRLVNLPAGRFLMGGLDARDDVEGGCTANERPTRHVYIAAFALGKYPVTFDEYDAFCEATNALLPDDQGWGRGKRPVINVSWDDAQAYCAWLCELNGAGYRLPSEAEWEYATRCGSQTAYPWGMQAQAHHANHNLQHGMTTPVDTYPANGFGLHDLCGNVWEWVQDCWHDSYHSAPSNAQAWEETGNHHERVLRGGSWNDRPRYLRAAYRVKDYANGRQIFRGFRVARSL